MSSDLQFIKYIFPKHFVSFNNLFLSKTIKLFFNNKYIFNLSTLLLIGIFTINYKTVVMLRGEIYILFFNSLLMFLFLKFIKKSFNYKKLDLFFSD